jgi:cellulose synthase/poly-beta-1,6-N-acetylglucosamine synthase-like glycosyltransferase
MSDLVLAERNRWNIPRLSVGDDPGWPLWALFFIYFAGLAVLLPATLLPIGTPTWLIIFLEILSVRIAIDLAELTCIFMAGRPRLPARLDALVSRPRVALVMVVCDDLVPVAAALLAGQTYPTTSVFILDDSSNECSRALVDALGFPVLRRGSRSGFKAGNLNNWLRIYGREFEYFVILDSDSILPLGCVQDLLHYAEHPANQKIAIFNTLPECWNDKARFPRLLSCVTPMRNWMRLRLDNLAATTLSTGHNNLHRTSAVLQAGGFNERLIAEDIALTLSLQQHGFRSVLTNVIAFEAEPEHIFSFVRRQGRWAAQAVQAASVKWGQLPLSARYQLFTLVWKYLGFFPYLAWALLTAWGAKSAWRDVVLFTEQMVLLRSWAGALHILILPALPLLISGAQFVIVRRSGVRLHIFGCHLLFCWILAFYSMFATCGAIVNALLGRKLGFRVTDKRERLVTFREVVIAQPLLGPFLLLVALGLRHNVAALVFALPWFCMLFACPLAVYWSHGKNCAHRWPNDK